MCNIYLRRQGSVGTPPPARHLARRGRAAARGAGMRWVMLMGCGAWCGAGARGARAVAARRPARGAVLGMRMETPARPRLAAPAVRALSDALGFARSLTLSLSSPQWVVFFGTRGFRLRPSHHALDRRTRQTALGCPADLEPPIDRRAAPHSFSRERETHIYFTSTALQTQSACT